MRHGRSEVKSPLARWRIIGGHDSFRSTDARLCRWADSVAGAARIRGGASWPRCGRRTATGSACSSDMGAAERLSSACDTAALGGVLIALCIEHTHAPDASGRNISGNEGLAIWHAFFFAIVLADAGPAAPRPARWIPLSIGAGKVRRLSGCTSRLLTHSITGSHPTTALIL